MPLTNTELLWYDSNVLRLTQQKRTEYHEQVDRLIKDLPDKVATQLTAADVLYIQVGTSVEGLVSLEREQSVAVRLFETTDNIESIKAAVTTVASRLPVALQGVAGETAQALALEDEVVIRQSQDGRTLAKGLIVTPHTLRFRSYLESERPRERRLLQWLGSGAVVCFAIGLFLALQAYDTVGARQVEGYAERICSALVVAFLTTVVNLVFEYRDWRNVRTEVQWLFG